MKNIKMRITSLCLAITLVFSGAFVPKVYADLQGVDPQKPKSAPMPTSPPEGSPEHCAICYVLWMLGL